MRRLNAPSRFIAEWEPPTTARRRFFALTELLEETLLHLPLPDIIKTQQINKSFKAVFTRSTKLQRAALFAPVAGRAAYWQGVSDRKYMGSIKHGMAVIMVFETTDGLCRGWDRDVLASMLKNGSPWKHLKISAPPCTHIRYTDAVDGSSYTVSNMEGLTMGDVFDAMKQRVPLLDRSSKLGPQKTRGLVKQLPRHVTGWEVTILFRELLAGIL